MRITRENRNMIEIVAGAHWIIIDPNGVVVNDNQTCEELDRFDWSNIKRLSSYSAAAYEKAIEKFKE